METTKIGLDLAKNVFQVHGINSASEVVVKKTLRRVQTRRFVWAIMVRGGVYRMPAGVTTPA